MSEHNQTFRSRETKLIIVNASKKKKTNISFFFFFFSVIILKVWGWRSFPQMMPSHWRAFSTAQAIFQAVTRFLFGPLLVNQLVFTIPFFACLLLSVLFLFVCFSFLIFFFFFWLCVCCVVLFGDICFMGYPLFSLLYVCTFTLFVCFFLFWFGQLMIGPNPWNQLALQPGFLFLRALYSFSHVSKEVKIN